MGLNGPFSENAPTPREEQPGPSKEQDTTQSISHQTFKFLSDWELFYLQVWKETRSDWGAPPLSQRTRGLESASFSASAK